MTQVVLLSMTTLAPPTASPALPPMMVSAESTTSEDVEQKIGEAVNEDEMLDEMSTDDDDELDGTFESVVVGCN